MERTEILGLIADAMRTVAMASDKAWKQGKCSAVISRCDLEETLLAVADELDPPTPKRKPAAAKKAAGDRPGPKALSNLFKM